MKTFFPSNKDELKKIILNRQELLFTSSKTSTVIPFSHVEKSEQVSFVSLENLPKKIQVKENSVYIEGMITWQELGAELRSQGKDICAAPTERLASVLAGISTNASGERSFRHGSIRQQVLSVKYMNYEGEVKELYSHKKLDRSWPSLPAYQKLCEKYEGFKNGPFPELQNETDLLIGMEGQLGVVLAAELKVVPISAVTAVAVSVPSWREDKANLLQFLPKIELLKDVLLSCELVDQNCLSFVAQKPGFMARGDTVFFEVEDRALEDFAQHFSDFESVITLSEKEFLALRSSVPRAIAEYINKNNLFKKGTDIQTSKADFPRLLELYAEAGKLNIENCLFGHFGNCHLHFNFLPRKDQQNQCDEFLSWLYDELKLIPASPFAEHGIGLLKQRFIEPYYAGPVRDVFKELKQEFDPHHQFFPQGFMCLAKERA